MQPEPAFAASSLAPLAEINDLALELMAQRASGETAGLPAILRESADLWRVLTVLQRHRLAGCPFLLVEFGFGGLSAQARHPLEGVRERRPGTQWFEEQNLPRLSYLTLTYAWHLARTRRLAARVVLGMQDDCADWLAALSLRELGECLEGSPRQLRPRWAGSPEVWRHLLVSAASPDPAALEQARLRGVQLLAAPYWPVARNP
jgi:hypothetical protein